MLNRIDASERGAGTLIIKDRAKDKVAGDATDLTATIYRASGDGFVRTVDDGVNAAITEYFNGTSSIYDTASGWRYGFSVGVEMTDEAL